MVVPSPCNSILVLWKYSYTAGGRSRVGVRVGSFVFILRSMGPSSRLRSVEFLLVTVLALVGWVRTLVTAAVYPSDRDEPLSQQDRRNLKRVRQAELDDVSDIQAKAKAQEEAKVDESSVDSRIPPTQSTA